jgi:hypothetical protein
VGRAVGLERADIFPVAVDDGAEQPEALVEHRGEHVAGEVDDLAGGDEVEHAGLQHVDAGVDRVGEHLTPRRLLEEPLDRAVVIGDHNAEVDGVVHPLQRDRGERLAIGVSLHHGGQVDVGDHVARDHEEGLVELVHRVANRTRGAERRVLGRVAHPYPELAAVTEVVADLVGEERDRDDDVVEPVLREQSHDVAHHRDVGDRQHRLRLVARERSESGAFAAGEDDCLHVTTFMWARFM